MAGEATSPAISLYTPRCAAYVSRRPGNLLNRNSIVRAETQNIVDEIKQAISLLRRHL